METHAGAGKLFKACYASIADGVVIEKDRQRAEFLAWQRPEWGVYSGDAGLLLRAGVGKEWQINFLDCDPYGSPWPTLKAFFSSERNFMRPMAVVVNDGLRQKLKTGSGWQVKELQMFTERFGNHRLYDLYLDICKQMLKEIAANYEIDRWEGYYVGNMTHYAAVLT